MIDALSTFPWQLVEGSGYIFFLFCSRFSAWQPKTSLMILSVTNQHSRWHLVSRCRTEGHLVSDRQASLPLRGFARHGRFSFSNRHSRHVSFARRSVSLASFIVLNLWKKSVSWAFWSVVAMSTLLSINASQKCEKRGKEKSPPEKYLWSH